MRPYKIVMSSLSVTIIWWIARYSWLFFESFVTPVTPLANFWFISMFFLLTLSNWINNYRFLILYSFSCSRILLISRFRFIISSDLTILDAPSSVALLLCSLSTSSFSCLLSISVLLSSWFFLIRSSYNIFIIFWFYWLSDKWARSCSFYIFNMLHWFFSKWHYDWILSLASSASYSFWQNARPASFNRLISRDFTFSICLFSILADWSSPCALFKLYLSSCASISNCWHLFFKPSCCVKSTLSVSTCPLMSSIFFSRSCLILCSCFN